MIRCNKCNRDFTNSSAFKRHRCIEVSSVLEAQIEALLERRKTTYDAEARFNIDIRIKELRGK